MRITQEQETETQEAFGDFLLLGLGSRGGYLRGNPARVERRDIGDQRVIGIASRINLRSEGGGEFLELVSTDGRRPELELIDPSGSLQKTSGEPSRLRVVCDGDIRVLPQAVRFLGAVELRSLNPDGSEDPEGLGIAADSVTMTRHRQTGAILGVDATGNVQLDWSGVAAWGHLLTLDPGNSLITVSDPNDKAVIQLPSGPRYSAAMVRANYETLRVMSWYGRVDGGRRGR